MSKTIFITGSTDGIGLTTAKKLAASGHNLLMHGRSIEKLSQAMDEVEVYLAGGYIEGYAADLSKLKEVQALAETIRDKHGLLDILINNAGVFKTQDSTQINGLDIRFVVNTIAPYFLTQELLPILNTDGRVINLSSAAQDGANPVNFKQEFDSGDDFNAYAQSKLGITMWTNNLADALKGKNQVIVSVNPGSLLGTKMVKEGFGMAGKDIQIGADIVIKAALSEEFSSASGQYFDNDSGEFRKPHLDAQNHQKCALIVEAIDSLIDKLLS